MSLALTYLRTASGWSRKELSRARGVADSLVSLYERGEKPLTREQLDSLVAPLGYPPEAVDALLFFNELIQPGPMDDASPVALTRTELQRVDRGVLAAVQAVAGEIRPELIRRKKKLKADAARREAQDLWTRMKPATPQERRDLVAIFPRFRNWALAERVCEASVRAAAHKAEQALELAELALFIAERMPGEETWRSRLQGYCWAHIANARRVANDFVGADEAFVRAWDLWRDGAETGLLPEWQLLSLEASLRREQHCFPAALELLDRAMAAGGVGTLAAGRILMKKWHILERLGDFETALAALEEAAPAIETAGDSALLFGLRFNTATNLCHLERYADAAELLSEVRELAVQQGNELNLIRVLWLEARTNAGQGRREEAMVGLEQVRRDFTARRLPYDAALSSLELAVLWLEDWRTAEVREMAVTMGWIFRAKGIHREALAALKLFREAAEKEKATVELTRRVLAEIEKVRRSAPQAA